MNAVKESMQVITAIGPYRAPREIPSEDSPAINLAFTGNKKATQGWLFLL